MKKTVRALVAILIACAALVSFSCTSDGLSGTSTVYVGVGYGGYGPGWGYGWGGYYAPPPVIIGPPPVAVPY